MQSQCPSTKPCSICREPHTQGRLTPSGAFFCEESLSAKDYAKAVVDLLGFKRKFDLCLDRTNWEFGDKDINYLVLSWRINKKISLPLFFVELDKAGNSNTAERLDLLHEFHEIFGFSRIKSLMGDREFIGKQWFQRLDHHKIPYFIRMKDNTLLPWGSDPIHAKQFFHHLDEGQTRLIAKEMYGGNVYFAGTLSKSNGLVIIMTNQKLNAAHILSKYRERWSIEELFRKLKTSGFHWENTHMTESTRLVSLLIILSFGLLIAFLMGQEHKIPWKKTLGCPLYSVFRQGLILLHHLVAQALSKVIDTILNLLQRAKNVFF